MTKFRLMLATLAALFMVAFTATAANAATQNYPDAYVPPNSTSWTQAFEYFLNTHPNQWIGVCVTAKGSSLSIKVHNGNFSKTLSGFPAGSFGQVCGSAYNYGYGTGVVSVSGVGGSGYLRQVTINKW